THAWASARNARNRDRTRHGGDGYLRQYRPCETACRVRQLWYVRRNTRNVRGWSEAAGPGELEGGGNAVDLCALARISQARRIVRERASGAIRTDDDGGMGGWLPPLYPEWLGDRSFAEAHGIRFPYATGSMANGIATPRLVIAVARAGMLGFYGAAGLSPHE